MRRRTCAALVAFAVTSGAVFAVAPGAGAAASKTKTTKAASAAKKLVSACALVTKADLVQAGVKGTLGVGENDPQGFVAKGGSACTIEHDTGYIGIVYEIESPSKRTPEEFFAASSVPIPGLPKGNVIVEADGDIQRYRAIVLRRARLVLVVRADPQVWTKANALALASKVYPRLP